MRMEFNAEYKPISEGLIINYNSLIHKLGQGRSKLLVVT